MIQDVHSHTYYSYCGKDSPEALIKKAIESGIQLLGICDHYYGIVMNRPGVSYDSDEHRIITHNAALKRYYEHIKVLADKYKDQIEVWCGVEITTVDKGFTLMPDGVDISMFDYCYIENFYFPGSVVDDVLAFAKRCGCKRTGIAHMNLPAYLDFHGLDRDEFFKKMKEQNVFWELNVNCDSIHGYSEHEYVKRFMASAEQQDIVRRAGLEISVGFDGHRVNEYKGDRVRSACEFIKESGLRVVEI